MTEWLAFFRTHEEHWVSQRITANVSDDAWTTAQYYAHMYSYRLIGIIVDTPHPPPPEQRLNNTQCNFQVKGGICTNLN